MKKTTIDLEDGRVVDCGQKEKDDLETAIKSGESKKVVLASVRLLQSSEMMMKDLVEKTFKEIEEVDKKYNS